MRKVKKLTDDYIYDDETYFKDRMYVTNSMLNQLSTGSTKKLEHYLNSEHKETESLLVGSAFHCYILESSQFSSRYIFEPKFDKRTKIGKEAYAEFLETIGDKKPIPEHYESKFDKIVDNLNNHLVANDLLSNGIATEKIHFWTDVETGIHCKGKIDLEGNDYIVDLKSTSKGADIVSFNEFIKSYNTTQQAAFYTNGTQKKNFYFIMCELKAPFGIGVYKMSEEALKHGNNRINQALKLYDLFNKGVITEHNEGKIIII